MTSRKSKVLALSAGSTLASIVTIAVTMLMARLLNKQDLAAYRQTFLAYATIAPLIQLGVGQAMFYFLPAEKVRVRGRVLDGLTLTGMMGFVFAIFIALGGNDLLATRVSNPQVAMMLLWMIPYALITTPTSLCDSVLVARDQAKTAALFGVARQLVIGLGAAIPLCIWQTPQASLIGNVIASLIMGAGALALIFHRLPHDSATPSFQGMAELVRFSLPLVLATMFANISLQLDKIIVSMLCSPEEFAVYSLGAMEIPLIGIITGSLTAVALTDMRKAIGADKPEEALRLFHLIAEKSSLVILPVMLFLMLTADSLMQYLYSSAYAESAYPFRVYLLLLPIRTVVFGSLIMALGKSKFIMYRSMVGLAISGTLSLLMVWQYGATGAAFANVATIYLWAVPANVHILSRELQVPATEVLPIRQIGKTAIMLVPIGIAALTVQFIIKSQGSEFVTLAIGFAVYFMVYWHGRLYTLEAIKHRFISVFA